MVERVLGMYFSFGVAGEGDIQKPALKKKSGPKIPPEAYIIFFYFDVFILCNSNYLFYLSCTMITMYRSC